MTRALRRNSFDAGGDDLDWDKLRIFHAAAEAGSFTHAGDTLNLSQSAVSRQVSALEKDLQTPLFHRHARGLMLTEQGGRGAVPHRPGRDHPARRDPLAPHRQPREGRRATCGSPPTSGSAPAG